MSTKHEESRRFDWRHRGLFGAVALWCLIPAGMWVTGLGIETGAGDYRQELSAAIAGDGGSWGYGLVQGATAYTMLEWTVVLLAMATAVIAYAHFHVKSESISLIIGVVAFWSGAVTAFHLLAFHGFSIQVTNLDDFVQFNWTVSQGFTALLLVGAAALVVWRDNRREEIGPYQLAVVVVGCSAVAYLIIFMTAQAPSLPTLTMPERIVSRPLDIVPLGLFAIAATVLFPRLHRMCESNFSLALWLSALPLMASQLYMAIGSNQLFDAGFTAAQLMKVSAFSIIFAGLVFNYARLCRNERMLQKKLTISDRRIRLLFDNAEEAIVIFDADRRIRAWNRCATEIFGWSSDELRDRDIVDLLFGDSAGDTDEERRDFRRHLSNFRRRIDVGTSSQIREMVVERSEGGEELTVEYTLVSTDEGEETVYAMLARDISRRKRMQMKMLQMDRLVAAGTLAAGVVHEIKNPLTYVSTNIALARETVDRLRQREAIAESTSAVEDLDEALDAAEEGSRRVCRIVEDMRAFSHNGDDVTEPVSVRRALELALRMTRGTVQKQARIETEIDDTPPVEADETRLSQVFVNLIINAAQAMESSAGGDVLTIELTSNSNEVIARFHDTGPGIEEAMQSRIFRPFFTTKAVGKGTGLGLALSKSIVEGFGGRIEVASTPTEGTTFEVRLPVATRR